MPFLLYHRLVGWIHIHEVLNDCRVYAGHFVGSKGGCILILPKELG